MGTARPPSRFLELRLSRCLPLDRRSLPLGRGQGLSKGPLADPHQPKTLDGLERQRREACLVRCQLLRARHLGEGNLRVGKSKGPSVEDWSVSALAKHQTGRTAAATFPGYEVVDCAHHQRVVESLTLPFDGKL